MSMTIGRCAITEDPDVGTLRQRGDEVSFSSMIVASSVDEMKARVQQLRGLIGNVDETVFPFTWSEDSTFDGFYADIRVEVSDMAVMLTTGACPFSITMRRVGGGFARPLVEGILTSVVRTNTHGITTPFGVSAVLPASVVDSDYSSLPTTGGIGVVTLPTDTGNVTVNTLTAPMTQRFWNFFSPPSLHYDGSARIEVLYGSTYYPVHGAQIPNSATWRISNGYCRLSPSASGAAGAFTIETYRAGSWVGREFVAGNYTGVFGGLDLTTDRPIIIRNSPESVTVRMSRIFSLAADFTIRTGDTWVECNLRYAPATLVQLGFATTAAVASTAFTGGLRATANDANGLRYLMSSTSATTNDLVNGRFYLTAAASSITAQITADYLAGISSTATTVRDLHFAARLESRRVVAR